MPLLTGIASVSRFHVKLDDPNFSLAAFREIPAGDEVNVPRSYGFVPMKPGAQYELAGDRCAGRVRMDEVKPDPVVVRDRYEELLTDEVDPPGKRRRQELAELAWCEAATGTTPRRRYVEWVKDGDLLYIGSASRPETSAAIDLFRKTGGTNILPATPWETLGDMTCDAVEANHPGQSVWGARFLRAVAASPSREMSVSLEEGAASLRRGDLKLSLSGDIRAPLTHHLDEGAEVISARLQGQYLLTIDGLSWWIKSLALPAPAPSAHWADSLGTRLAAIRDAFEWIDSAFADLRPKVEEEAREDGRTHIQETIPGVKPGRLEGTGDE